jgi:hypothetical protein
MRFIQSEIKHNTTWNKVGNGRHNKAAEVAKWRADHIDGKKADCIRDTGLDKKTVYKWWDYREESEK